MLLLLPTLSDGSILIHGVSDVLAALLAVLHVVHDNIVFIVVLGRWQLFTKYYKMIVVTYPK